MCIGFGTYVVDDVAGFPPHVAQKLIERGDAKPYVGPKA